MLIPNRFYTLFFIGILIIFADTCTNQTPTNSAANANSQSVATNGVNAGESTVSKDDTAELGSMILLPFVPEETNFREEPDTAKPNAKKLIAVLKFSSEDAKNLIAQAAKHRPAEQVQISAEEWFPAELIAQTQLSGDESLKGTAYGANDFMQMPYKTGRLIKVENSDYFILEISE